ncbi:polysaccharide deacetylase family protein [Streptococcus massiliensis]|uniref:Xylanase/chitin deacetylase n=1 Tax=Streptococcus massiliensis TaxID=313439 RepID=A0A380KVQ9_9STRE|nr:polysaccharide deacetylase family protein [Streptococcus massiliensis]SUN76023.1 xylanase/chitin deacetylase [Streptococcus massiliensis]
MAKHVAKPTQPPRPRRRTKRRLRKGRIIGISLLAVLAALLVVTGTFYAINHLSNSGKPVQPVDSKIASTTKQSSTTDSSSSTEEQIKWVKQDKPVQVPILMYHAIHVMDPSEAANAGLIVNPDTFESQLKALKDAGYYPLSPAEAYKVLTENVLPENKKVVWLTFDDSNEDFYTHALPILQKYKMKATNNVITGFVEEGRASILTLEQMKEMKAKGMSFEDHTVHHPDLSASDSTTQETELKDSKSYLDKNLSQNTTTVAYPSGRYTDTTLQIAESLGYKLGLTTNEGLASASNGLLSLNRIRVTPDMTAETLLATIATN